MKRTLNKISYELLTVIRQLHDDSDIDIRLIQEWIQSSRAVWLTNELNKFKPVSPEFIQDLGCVELVPVDPSTCGLSECTLLRTNLEMPVFLEAGQEAAITRVGPSIVTSSSFKVIAYERLPFVGNGRFNSNSIYAFLIKPYLYLYTKSDSLEYAGMRKINIRGILGDPTDAVRFTNSDGTPCYTDNSYYPITDRLVTYLKDMVIQSNIKIMLSLVPDKLNNASDDTAGQQQQELQTKQ